MIRPRLVCKPTSESTRILLTHHDREILRAQLPPPSQVHFHAGPSLCESLALWLQTPLSVVLVADAQGASSALNLSDGLGFGLSTLHYDVEVLEPGRRRARPLGSFADLRQLDLRGVR